MWTIIIILLILWAFGFFSGSISPRIPKTGGWIHTLLVIALILIILDFLNVI